MPFFYSAKNNAFYPEELFYSYDISGSWPEDAIRVDDDIYNEFSAEIAPEGKVRIAGEGGMPVWDSIPSLSDDLVVSLAENKKNQLLISATDEITSLQDAVDLAMATSEETELLLEWKRYRVLLSRIDAKAALDPDIVWPDRPKGLG
ncbi:tail fiber assembly protein [Cedecea sp. MMO-103]|uniref:tail fiber assembly protein n=1 Tax=Cedecea sp. MMO-103 TaxID=3081238 RepID=UPI0030177FED